MPNDRVPNEPNLRSLFREAGDPPGRTLDAQEIIRRSRRRRLPRQVGFGSALTLAVVGVGAAGFSGLRGAPTGGSAFSAQDSGGTSTTESAPVTPLSGKEPETGGATGGIKRAPAEKINLCGGELSRPAPSESGLVVTTHFPATAPAGTQSIAGTVTFTNMGTRTLHGFTSPSPTVTLSRNGVVMWHSNGPVIDMAVIIDLAPGESLRLKSSFTPVVCGVEDDLNGFRDNLPAASPGSYQLSAAADFTGDFAADLITGPTANILLK
ncbi:MAG: hypothetical protein JWQ12_100 [Glaciihabitans sp.]|nr:hypothetical protein [Glaciihabitans sp.]